MKRFCTQCGKEITEGASFCTSCGTPLQQPAQQPPLQQPAQQPPLQQPAQQPPLQQPYQQPYYPSPPQLARHARRRRPLWVRVTVPAVITALLLTLFGFGIYKAGQVTGIWNRMATDKAAEAWTKQSGYKSEEKAIQKVLADLQTALEAGDYEAAQAFFDPYSLEEVQALFAKYPDRLPVFAQMLGDCRITYLSTDTGNYEALRMATVEIGTPTPGAGLSDPESGTGILILTKTENGWVVTKIS